MVALMVHCNMKLLVKMDTFCSVEVPYRTYQMDSVHQNFLANRHTFLEKYSSADITLIPFKVVASPLWVRSK